MGRTYNRDKSFDDRSSKGKKRLLADQQRKQDKHRIVDVVYEDEDDIEFEEEYEIDYFQHRKQKRPL